MDHESEQTERQVITERADQGDHGAAGGRCAGGEETTYRHGYLWVKCTQKMMTVHIPFLTEDMVRHSVRKLIDKGIIKVGVFDDDRFDHTYWYTFTDYGEELLDDGICTE